MATGSDKKAFSGHLRTQHSSDQEGEALPSYDDSSRPGLWTRIRLTPDSFRRRTLADKHNQLNQTLKSRHLNMSMILKYSTQESLSLT